MNINSLVIELGLLGLSHDTKCSFFLDDDPIGYPINFHSWRGAYDYLGIGLECTQIITLGEFIDKLEEFEPGNYIGWKGGDNNLDYYTDFFLDNGPGTVGDNVMATNVIYEDEIIKIVCEKKCVIKQ